ncbi:MAG: hypothetical protein Q8T11_12885 [Elusimicrobiota bacterium]|nr:hypothetical protein [Elusimicrobiota bacterium]
MRRAFAAVLSAAFFVQSTGAADLAPALARGMMLPPPGRMAAMPPAGAAATATPPKGEPWLASARVVARWTRERLSAALAAPAAVEEAPSEQALAALAAVARNQALVVASLPAPEPPADRMLIAMEGRRILASGLAAQLSSILQYRSDLKPIRPAFIGRWVGDGAVRARVDYLKPLGVTRGEAKGFRVTLSDGYERLLPNRGEIPESLKQELPLYFAGDSVDLEVRLRNDGPATLTDLRLASVQEDHTASGAPGAPLSSPVFRSVASLAPGQTVILRWRIKLSAEGREAVNFEQTHLRVLGQDPSGGEKVHLDEAQAGIVDPPGAQ